jgi:hypothetical protein
MKKSVQLVHLLKVECACTYRKHEISAAIEACIAVPLYSGVATTRGLLSASLKANINCPHIKRNAYGTHLSIIICIFKHIMWLEHSQSPMPGSH